jgi:2-dehydro-3-deoxygalactonokinase
VGAPRFLVGDWGTTYLRLHLCDDTGAVLDSVSGPGAADAAGRFAQVFDELSGRWRSSYGALPVTLCGMVGSNIGWAQAPYVACPTRLETIGSNCVSTHGGLVHIIPGLSCRNRCNAPDFLRGEETQILGALQLDQRLQQGRHLLCLPGTHTKWVMLEDASVRDFLTAPTGELFGLLREHSVLLRGASGVGAGVDGTAFARGLAHFNEFPQAQILHRLFECRSRLLSGELSTTSVSAFLSGLLIASDIAGARQLLPGTFTDGKVHLVGAPTLTALYAAGLAARGNGAQELDGAAASLAGLRHVYDQLTRGATAHATA